MNECQLWFLSNLCRKSIIRGFIETYTRKRFVCNDAGIFYYYSKVMVRVKE